MSCPVTRYTIEEVQELERERDFLADQVSKLETAVEQLIEDRRFYAEQVDNLESVIDDKQDTIDTLAGIVADFVGRTIARDFLGIPTNL